MFIGLTRNDIGGGGYDLIDRAGSVYEARTITNGGVKLAPSNQYGQGRIRDDDAMMERRERLHAYIFVDVRESPLYRIFALLSGSEHIGNRRDLTTNMVNRIISDYPRRRIPI